MEPDFGRDYRAEISCLSHGLVRGGPQIGVMAADGVRSKWFDLRGKTSDSQSSQELVSKRVCVIPLRIVGHSLNKELTRPSGSRSSAVKVH